MTTDKNQATCMPKQTYATRCLSQWLLSYFLFVKAKQHTTKARKAKSIRGTILVALIYPSLSNADWIDPGASYICDAKHNSFEIYATMNSSDGPLMPLQTSFIAIPRGNTRIACKLNNTTVIATIKSTTGGEKGMCAATGTIKLNLLINGRPVIKNELFNSGCHLEPVLYNVKVDAHNRKNSPNIQICRGTWDWEKSYQNEKCNELST